MIKGNCPVDQTGFIKARFFDIIKLTMKEAQQEENLSRVSDDVIAVCAANASLRTEGVAALAGGFSNVMSLALKRKESLSKGITVDTDKKGLVLDVFVITRFGAKIPEVAWDIQQNVRNEVEHMTDLTVSEINVHVQGVVRKAEGRER